MFSPISECMKPGAYLLLIGLAWLIFMLIVASQIVEAKSDSIYAQSCPYKKCLYGIEGVVDMDAPKYGTKEWMTLCYNQFQTHEERIKFCS